MPCVRYNLSGNVGRGRRYLQSLATDVYPACAARNAELRGHRIPTANKYCVTQGTGRPDKNWTRPSQSSWFTGRKPVSGKEPTSNPVRPAIDKTTGAIVEPRPLRVRKRRIAAAARRAEIPGNVY